MTSTATEWKLPIEHIIEKHKGRIEGNEDMVPFMVESWHEGEDEPSWITMIGPTGKDIEAKEAALHAAKVMGNVTACDYLVLAFDTHMSRSMVNPTTGEPWGPGEMQRMCDEEGYCDTGNIRDNLCVAIVRRSDKKLYFHSIPYHFHGDHSLLMLPDEQTISEWDESSGSTDELVGKMQGRIPDLLREAVNVPSIQERMTEMGVDLSAFGFEPGDEPLIRLHQILAGVRILSQTAIEQREPMMFMSMIPTRTDAEREIVERTAQNSNLEFLNLGDDDTPPTSGAVSDLADAMSNLADTLESDSKDAALKERGCGLADVKLPHHPHPWTVQKITFDCPGIPDGSET